MGIALTLTFPAAGGRIGLVVCPIPPARTILPSGIPGQSFSLTTTKQDKSLPGEPVPLFTGYACLPEDAHEQVDADL
jgi:hypothetical protein